MVTETAIRFEELQRRVEALEGQFPKNASQKTQEGHVHMRMGLPLFGGVVYRSVGSASIPHVEFNEGATGDAFMRLENRVGVGMDPAGNTVFRIGMPTVGTAIGNQFALLGTKTQTVDAGVVSLVSFATVVATSSFTGTNLRGFLINLGGTQTTGNFGEVNGFRLNNVFNAQFDDLAWFSFPHPATGGDSAAVNTIGGLDFGDFDELLLAAAPIAYCFRIGDRGGRDPTPFGGPTMAATGTAIPFWQQLTTEAMVALYPGNFYNVFAANTAFGADQAATAFADLAASTSAYPSLRIRAGTAPGAPNEGDVWHDSTRKSLTAFMAGVNQQDTRTLFTQNASATVANTATETSLRSTIIGNAQLPANFFAPGKTIRLRAWGFFASDGTAGQTLTIRVRLGGTTGTIVGATGAISLPAIVANRQWRLEIDITCRTTGAAGTVFSQGGWFCPDAVATYANDGVAVMVNAATITIDTTAIQEVQFTADWNSADAGDTITCTNSTLEVLN